MSAAAAALWAAEAHLGRGGLRGAIARVLEAWRAVPAPPIAQLLDDLASSVTRSATLPGRTRAERLVSWSARCAGADPADVVLVVRALGVLPHALVLEHLPKLGSFEPNPVLARELVRTFLHRASFSRQGFAVWEAVAGLLEHQPDGLALELALRIVGPRRVRFIESTEALRERVVELPTHLDDEAASALAAARTRLETSPSGRIEGLFADVYAEPGSDAPRHVLADALLEVGDPRGELLVLQLSPRRGPKELRREKALLGAHGKAWLGRLAQVVGATSRFTFERGFVSRLALDLRAPATLAAATSAPELVTVEELVLEPPARLGPLLDPARLPALRTLLGADASDLPTLASFPLLERLSLSVHAHTPEAEALLAAALPSRISHLTVELRASAAAGVPIARRLLARRRPGRLDVGLHGWALEAQAVGAAGWDVTVRPNGADYADHLCPLLPALSPVACRRLVFAGAAPGAVVDELRADLEEQGFVDVALPEPREPTARPALSTWLQLRFPRPELPPDLGCPEHLEVAPPALGQALPCLPRAPLS